MNLVRRQIALAVLIAAAAPRTWTQVPGPVLNPAGADWFRFLRPQVDFSRAALDGYQRSLRDMEAFLALGPPAAFFGRNVGPFPPLLAPFPPANQQVLFQQRALNNSLSLQELLRRLFPTPQPPAVRPVPSFAPVTAERQQL
ncbi:hypothetical protein HPB50_027972 [Hyalomma asiaticum]|nr:hypothetical protein HPB50_027972 [Hyalomma asiaticum]